ncbi:MAG: hypothetical protein HZB19_19975 [Chloroflexi bacterium]|nr:hypothetical protein [Chloroflexota bacterium]
MRLNKNLASILLAVYLILVGLQALFGLSFSAMGFIMGICALGAGILLLLNR